MSRNAEVIVSVYSKMPAPYSDDLRYVIVFQKFGCEKSLEQIADEMGISKRTVKRVCERFVNYGTVQSAQIGRPAGSTIFHPHEVYILLEFVLEHPTAYLKEILSHVHNITGGQFHMVNIWRFLRRNCFSRKRVSKAVI